jgi:anti-sigma B factor antagonist
MAFHIEYTAEGRYRLHGQLLASEIEGAASALEPVQGDLVLDLADLQYVSSAGLRLFLRTQARLADQGHALRLVNLGDHIRDLMEVTGLDQIFDLDDRP